MAVPAYVQSNATMAGTPGTTITRTFTGAVTAGNCLVAFIGNVQGPGTAISTVADNVNGTWPAAVLTSAHNRWGAFYLFPNTAGAAANGMTVTGTWPGSIQGMITIMEFSGVKQTAPLDQTATNFSAAATSVTVGPTSATGAATEAVIAAFYSGSGVVWTAGSGYTSVTGSGTVNEMTQYAITSVAGPQTATGTTSASISYDALLITLLPSGIPVPTGASKAYFAVRTTPNQIP